METRLEYKRSQFHNAILDFSRSLTVDQHQLSETLADIVKNGQVQKFEFCTELLWKVLKIFLEEVHGFDDRSPKSVVKRVFTLGYLNPDEYETIMVMLDDRNKMSHLYNKEQFFAVYERVITTVPVMLKVYDILK